MKYQAFSDFEIHDPHPMLLRVGDMVVLGRRDSTWTEWIWITDQDGKSGWMHESCLHFVNENSAKVSKEFSSAELSIKKKEVVTSLCELGGWHWCQNHQGKQGWIPAYAIDRLDEHKES